MKSKLVSFLGIAVMAFGVVSCSSDDGSSTRDNNKLVGKWEWILEMPIDGNKVLIDTYVKSNGVCPLDSEEFVGGGVNKGVTYAYSDNLTECTPYPTERKWKVEGNKLKLEGLDGVEIVTTIMELDGDKMMLDRPMKRSEAEDYPENTVTIRNVFKKVK